MTTENTETPAAAAAPAPAVDPILAALAAYKEAAINAFRDTVAPLYKLSEDLWVRQATAAGILAKVPQGVDAALAEKGRKIAEKLNACSDLNAKHKRAVGECFNVLLGADLVMVGPSQNYVGPAPGTVYKLISREPLITDCQRTAPLNVPLLVCATASDGNSQCIMAGQHGASAVPMLWLPGFARENRTYGGLYQPATLEEIAAMFSQLPAPVRQAWLDQDFVACYHHAEAGRV